MIKKLLSKIVSIGMMTLVSEACLAATPSGGVGSFADAMMDPVGLFSDFLFAGCIIIGGSFVFASVVKYFEHRRSPLMVPLSTVVFLFILGCALLGIPTFSYIYTHAVGFSITK